MGWNGTPVNLYEFSGLEGSSKPLQPYKGYRVVGVSKGWGSIVRGPEQHVPEAPRRSLAQPTLPRHLAPEALFKYSLATLDYRS